MPYYSDTLNDRAWYVSDYQAQDQNNAVPLSMINSLKKYILQRNETKTFLFDISTCTDQVCEVRSDL